jgi:2,3-dihydroxybiphenyl 1,2-dioxygenase
MALSSFGYFGVHSDKLDDWASYGPSFLGLELVDRTSTMLKFRMDDRKQRIIVSSAPEILDTFGWEVTDKAELDRIAARVEAASIPVSRLSSAEVQLRGVTEAIRFHDPAGNRLEVFRGPEIASAPVRPGRSISGFRTGPFGMGHAVLYVASVEDVQWFYMDVLGFRLSDYALRPFKAYFFHLNGRHHSLALIEGGKRRIHHIMMELDNIDDVGQAYDLALSEPGRIATTLGRHTNDFMTSFYARTPSEFFVEYGWGGRIIDPAAWVPTEMQYGPSLWGHDRTWLPADQLVEARALRAQAAQDGLRQPVQVDGGNYHTGVSGCAWWEEVKQSRPA